MDEVQDVDRAQLRLALLLAEPANRILLVGDDDQSIYGWRLADVRRVLGLDAVLPGLVRVDLEVNYRCPAPVVERAVRLVEHNRERFAKRIGAGPAATGTLVLAPDADDDPIRLGRAMALWPDDDSTRAVLARTNRELIPAVVVAMAAGIPFRAARLELPLEDARARRRAGGRAGPKPAGRAAPRDARPVPGGRERSGRPASGGDPPGLGAALRRPRRVRRTRSTLRGSASPSSDATTPG